MGNKKVSQTVPKTVLSNDDKLLIGVNGTDQLGYIKKSDFEAQFGGFIDSRLVGTANPLFGVYNDTLTYGLYDPNKVNLYLVTQPGNYEMFISEGGDSRFDLSDPADFEENTIYLIVNTDGSKEVWYDPKYPVNLDVPGGALSYDVGGASLKYFVEDRVKVVSESSVDISTASLGVLKVDNTTLTDTNNKLKFDIATTGFDRLYTKQIRFATIPDNLALYCSVLGKKPDNSYIVLKQAALVTGGFPEEEFYVDLSEVVSISICWNSSLGFTPTFKLQATEELPVENSVKNYIDDSVATVAPNTYNATIPEVSFSIDDMTGADDDAKIDHALMLAENVGGAQIIFPNRTVNITKAIYLLSNVKYVLNGTHIQMANSIHDNIFRPKNLQVNSSQPGGMCLGADWTENFEIEGLSGATIRQSITPLHVGDAYGWRGTSMLFTRCRHYRVTGIEILESHMWSISNEYSENGYFENISFSNTLYPNADGINFRNGCRNMVARTLRGVTNDNAVATTCLDNTVPVSPNAGYTYQALGFNFGDFYGAENIIVEDVQVQAMYGVALVIASSPTIKNVTYKDIQSTTASTADWELVSLCANHFRAYVYGSTYTDGNISNINLINCGTTRHEYAVGLYGGRIDHTVVNRIVNTNPSKLGDIYNDTTSVITTV